MLKQSTNPTKTKQSLLKSTALALLLCTAHGFALDADKDEDFLLEGDNFKNLPEVVKGETKIKYWGHVVIGQGSI